MTRDQAIEPTRMHVLFAFLSGSSILYQGEFLIKPEKSVTLFGEHGHVSFSDEVAFADQPGFLYFSGLTIEHAFEIPACPLTLCYYLVAPDPETSLPCQNRVLRSELRMGVHDSEDWESIELLQYTLAFKCTPLT